MPCMWKVLPTYVHIKGGIVYPYVYGFLSCSGKGYHSLPTMLKLSNVVGWPVVDW